MDTKLMRKIRRPSRFIKWAQLIGYPLGLFFTYFIGDIYALLFLFLFILIFFISVLASIKAINNGHIKILKELTNTIWNISTAVSFSYATYLLFRYKIHSTDNGDVTLNYILLHPYLSFITLFILVLIAIFRAAISIAEFLKVDNGKDINFIHHD